MRDKFGVKESKKRGNGQRGAKDGSMGKEVMKDPEYPPASLNGYRPWAPKPTELPIARPVAIRKLPDFPRIKTTAFLRKKIGQMTMVTLQVDKYMSEMMSGKPLFEKPRLRDRLEKAFKGDLKHVFNWSFVVPIHVIEAHIMVLVKLMSRTFYSYAAVHGYYFPSLLPYNKKEPSNAYFWRDHETAMMLGKAVLIVIADGRCDKMPDVKSLVENFAATYKWFERKTSLIDTRGTANQLMEEDDCFSMLSSWNEYCLFQPKLSDEQREMAFDMACSSLSGFTSLRSYVENNKKHFADVDHFRRLLPVLKVFGNHEFGFREITICREIFYQTFPKLSDDEFMKLCDEARDLNLNHEMLKRLMPHAGGAKFLEGVKPEEQSAALHFNLLLVPWDRVLESCITGVFNKFTETRLIEILANLLPSVRRFLLESEEGRPSRLISFLGRLNPGVGYANEGINSVLTELVNSRIVNHDSIVFDFLFPGISMGSVPFRKLAIELLYWMVFNEQLKFYFFDEEVADDSICWSKFVMATLDLYAPPNPKSQSAQRYSFLKKLLLILDKKGAEKAKVEDILKIFDHLQANASKAWLCIIGNALMKETVGKHVPDKLPWKKLREEEFDEIFSLIGAFPDKTGVDVLKRILEDPNHIDQSEELLTRLQKWIEENIDNYSHEDTRIRHLIVYPTAKRNASGATKLHESAQTFPESVDGKTLGRADREVVDGQFIHRMDLNQSNHEASEDKDETIEEEEKLVTDGDDTVKSEESSEMDETQNEDCKETGDLNTKENIEKCEPVINDDKPAVAAAVQNDEVEKEEVMEQSRSNHETFSQASGKSTSTLKSITLANHIPMKFNASQDSWSKPPSIENKVELNHVRNDNYGCVTKNSALSDFDTAWEKAPTRNVVKRGAKGSETDRHNKSQGSKRSSRSKKKQGK